MVTRRVGMQQMPSVDPVCETKSKIEIHVPETLMYNPHTHLQVTCRFLRNKSRSLRQERIEFVAAKSLSRKSIICCACPTPCLDPSR